MVHITSTFCKLHQRSGAFVIPNPWDVGSARLLSFMGFEALATTSSGMAFALGLPDGAVTPKRVLKHCRDIVAATHLPVSADLEKGFGDSPESVAETIVAAAETGLAGCSIEDYSGNPGAPIFTEKLAIERITAAVEAARKLDSDFVLTARCESLLWGERDLDKVISRLQAFESAGADVLYAPGLNSLEAIRTVCAAVNKPVNVVVEMPGKSPSISDLAAAGVKRISIGALFARMAYGSLITAGREILTTGTFDFAESAFEYEELEGYFRKSQSDFSQ